MMATCKECKKYFPLEDDPNKGDCVQRMIDPRQAYYQAKLVTAEKDAARCSSFEKK
ncbi:MAG TPA: benzylsuccinate synthase gamma subunit family protein [Desulfomonilia bacterium]|nr:benzylsuccinate synthase gamma subunit family protein [Desulfomonilia bacterium]